MTNCLVCGNPPDYCPGGHGWACDDCDGYRDGHAEGCPNAPESAQGIVEAIARMMDPDNLSTALVDAWSLAQILNQTSVNEPLSRLINLPDDELRIALAWLNVLSRRVER